MTWYARKSGLEATESGELLRDEVQTVLRGERAV